MDTKLEETVKRIRNISKDGKITCAQARKLAEDLGISYSDVGEAADQLKIKIHSCQLGCF